MPQDMYYCLGCKKTVSVTAGAAPPVCCGKPMKKQAPTICLQPSHPEHARSFDADDACDDFRAGNTNESDFVVCDVCKSKVAKGDTAHVHIKGEVKKICPECVTAIKGFA
jgi:hypothetical protein